MSHPTITFQAISHSDASAQFPGCIFVLGSEYARRHLGLRRGKLYSSVKKNGWQDWLVWNGNDWDELAEVDLAFDSELGDSDVKFV